MTPKEADQVAQQCLPVIFDGITYTRIVRVGYSYDENGRRSSVLTLLDKNKNCIVGAAADKVKPVELPGTVSRCKGCGAVMVWIPTPAGKQMPCDATPVKYRADPAGKAKIVTAAGEVLSCEISPAGETDGYGWIPHWSTCPRAGDFKRGGQT